MPIFVCWRGINSSADILGDDSTFFTLEYYFSSIDIHIRKITSQPEHVRCEMEASQDRLFLAHAVVTYLNERIQWKISQQRSPILRFL